ncbi:MAG: methylenetetrahydrofolate reductase [Endomicrobium sp.]|jgi:5,10-methylenetetrahydrofolate reductase|nr:methylenetetrahydrofolate reductase [Endomicrobium sp.]
MTFKEKLKSEKFLITAELFPPKGTDVSSFFKRAQALKGLDAVNVTDNQRASMRTGSLAMCRLLLEEGIEPVLQLACRDKNRIALQSELLSASVLGINNVLILSGDHPDAGEYKGAKAVYDLDTVQLIKTARLLETGFDLAGKKLTGAPRFCIGAVANPSASPQELQALMFEKKVKAGAEFFQTQSVFDIEEYKNFYDKIKGLNVPVIAGVTLIKSAKFMSFLKMLPGVTIPQSVQDAINNAKDELSEGIKICAQTIKELRLSGRGVHIMAIGMEEHIPEIIERSKL